MELVCKKWKRVIQKNQSLWKDASYCEENQTISLHLINIRSLRLFTRCGQNISSLSLSLPVQIFHKDQSFIQMFRTILLLINPKHLWLHLWPEIERHPAAGKKSFKRSAKRKTYEDTELICEAVVQCSNLETLCLRTERHGGPRYDRLAQHITEGRPIVNCQLKKLVLEGFDLAHLFTGGAAILKMLSMARTIDLGNNMGVYDCEHFFNFFATTKDTIEEISLKADYSNWLASPFKAISMPKLRYLDLRLIDCSEIDPSCPILICPSLRHLTLHLNESLHLFGNLLNSPEFESLTLAEISEHFEIEQDTIDLLWNTAIKSLTLVGSIWGPTPNDSVALLKLLGGLKQLQKLKICWLDLCCDRALQKAIQTLPVEEISIEPDCLYCEEDWKFWEYCIRSLIESRQKEPCSTKIRKLIVMEPNPDPMIDPENARLSDEGLKWLQENVEDFTYIRKKELDYEDDKEEKYKDSSQKEILFTIISREKR